MSRVDQIALAPMEGLADDILRDILTRAGTYDWCVTEFVRVSATVLPAASFLRVSPELRNAARTQAGTPVRVQLLGSDPALLAANAAVLARLKPAGIDLNFGCPVPLVNRNRGGAALLDDPELLRRIVARVREVVPAEIPVTAKMRLGIEDRVDFPGFVLHQILNSIGTRQIITHGPNDCELVWTLLGFEEDTPEQTAVRVKQANLVGPAGLVSMEDGAIGGFVQKGIAGDLDNVAVIEMGGRGVGGMPTRATETSVRGFWKVYRELLGV